jgi:hypothetical protein
MQKLKFVRNAGVVGALGALASAPVAAADWTTMTTGLSFDGEQTAIIAIVGVLFSFYVVRKGATLLLSMIR